MGKFAKSAKSTATATTKKPSWPEIPETVRVITSDTKSAALQAQLAAIAADATLSQSIKTMCLAELTRQIQAAGEPVKLCITRGLDADGAPMTSKSGKPLRSICITGPGFFRPAKLSIPFLRAIIDNADAVRQWLADVSPILSTADQDDSAA